MSIPPICQLRIEKPSVRSWSAGTPSAARLGFLTMETRIRS